jgi:hypothetical protein
VLFFAVNLGAGIDAAVAALATEAVFQAATADFYGALTQAVQRAEPSRRRAWPSWCCCTP